MSKEAPLVTATTQSCAGHWRKLPAPRSVLQQEIVHSKGVRSSLEGTGSIAKPSKTDKPVVFPGAITDRTSIYSSSNNMMTRDGTETALLPVCREDCKVQEAAATDQSHVEKRDLQPPTAAAADEAPQRLSQSHAAHQGDANGYSDEQLQDISVEEQHRIFNDIQIRKRMAESSIRLQKAGGTRSKKMRDGSVGQTQLSGFFPTKSR
jgi:hypothetical protein